MSYGSSVTDEATRIEAIQQGLREAGFVVGRNLTIERRFADGYNERLPVLAEPKLQQQAIELPHLASRWYVSHAIGSIRGIKPRACKAANSGS
jgi:hypothetical protein